MSDALSGGPRSAAAQANGGHLQRVASPSAGKKTCTLKPFFSLWFDRIVPLLGKLLPGGSAYTYLPASVKRFPPADELAELMRAAGFADVRFELVAGGIVARHLGTHA